jgi:aldose 1-epimerase
MRPAARAAFLGGTGVSCPAGSMSRELSSAATIRLTEDPAALEREIDLDGVQLVSADGALQAWFVPAAGIVCSSLRHRGDELLAQGNGIAAYARQGATMGIPLLYPWANRLASHRYEAAGRAVDLTAASPRLAVDENGLPIHGLIPGEMSWKLDQVSFRASALSASLDWDTPPLLEVFPFPHRLEYEAWITANSLTIAVTVQANRNEPVPVSFGFHPYLSLEGAPRSDWIVDLPVCERLVLDEAMIPTGSREPMHLKPFRLGDTSWDDAFAALAREARFTASSARRKLAVQFLHGYEYAQVYAPSDSEFICFEPMTAPTNALGDGTGPTVLQPGDTYRASFRVAVEPA